MPIPPAGRQAYAIKPQPASADAEKVAKPKSKETGGTEPPPPHGTNPKTAALYKAAEVDRDKLLGAALRKRLPTIPTTQVRTVTLPSSKTSGDNEPAPNRSTNYIVPGEITPSRLKTLDLKLRRQADIDDRIVKQISMSDLNDGSATLDNGTYVFIVTNSDPQLVRLFNDSYEKEYMANGKTVGHSSLVPLNERNESTIIWAGLLSWNNGLENWNDHSGHYQPDADDYELVGLDIDKFETF